MLPNISGPVIAYTTLLIPGMISTEAALSFLGVGVRPPTPSWGQMIAEAVAYYETDPMYFIVPSAFLFVAVLAFTVLGDALRDILDPQGGRP
ncbi:Peptide ABC transporter permease OS=Streptomyces microflavus OX=1919 GN=Smic_85790 PE=3 SV=1 [Streptomyces microflavus]